GTQSNANERAWHAQHRTPHGVVDRARRYTVKAGTDPFVLLGIQRLIWFNILIALSVAVGVQHDCRPALGRLFIMGLVVNPGVEPAFDLTAAREPEDAVLVEVQVMRSEAGIDSSDLLGFRIVHLHLTAALLNRKCL